MFESQGVLVDDWFDGCEPAGSTDLGSLCAPDDLVAMQVVIE
jgi:hypothetical protein